MRRVVVTGLGMVTPLAAGVEETWARPVSYTHLTLPTTSRV